MLNSFCDDHYVTTIFEKHGEKEYIDKHNAQTIMV
jgi:hypothetical protein